MDGAWALDARDRIAETALLIVGIGVDQMRGFVDAGGRVVGAVCVLCDGAPVPAVEPFPVLPLFADSRQIFDLVVREYAATLARARRELTTFFDRVDPHRTATVVSYLPLPHWLLGERPTWAQNADVTAPLERKEAAAALLAELLPTAPAEIVAAPLPNGWWERACGRWATSAIVLQEFGASGGGSGTYFCRSATHVAQILASLPGQRAKAMPLLSGIPVNVMGVAIDASRVVVLPPSEQLLHVDRLGRPAWAGNVFGEPWSGGEHEAIRSEVREVGRRLAARGFFGPFGVDFLRVGESDRIYLDLNPRMNGAVDALALYLEGLAVRLTTLLLQRPDWPPEQIASIEAGLTARVARRPSARYFVSRRATQPDVVREVRPGGLWSLNPRGPTLSPLAAEARLADIGGDRVLLSPILRTGVVIRPDDHVVYGALTCDLALRSALEAAHGSEVHERLADAVFG